MVAIVALRYYWRFFDEWIMHNKTCVLKGILRLGLVFSSYTYNNQIELALFVFC